MQENILEHTTSIAGLTCKPLAILSETISPEEMSMVRGGTGGTKEKDKDTIDPSTVPSVWDVITTFLGFPPGQSKPKPDFVYEGPQIPINPPEEPADPFAALLTDTDSSDPDDPYADHDPFQTIAEADSLSHAESGIWEGEEDDENCEYCDDENCDGCANNDDDEDDDSSGLDGMEGDFDLSENEMFT